MSRYTITNPDTTKMEKVRKDALELYRREYGTQGEDPYRLQLQARERAAGVPTHERLCVCECEWWRSVVWRSASNASSATAMPCLAVPCRALPC